MPPHQQHRVCQPARQTLPTFAISYPILSMTTSSKDASTLHDLTDLVDVSGPSTIRPTEDTLLSLLQARFRLDLPYTFIASSNLLVVNPLKSLANTNEASAFDYEEKTYRDVTDAPSNLPPHLYELASRIYLVMRRTSQSQSVLFR